MPSGGLLSPDSPRSIEEFWSTNPSFSSSISSPSSSKAPSSSSPPDSLSSLSAACVEAFSPGELSHTALSVAFVNTKHLQARPLVTARRTEWICTARSCVGTKTTALTPFPSIFPLRLRAGSASLTMIGKAYARVLPEPVGATHIVSLPSRRHPPTEHWTPQSE